MARTNGPFPRASLVLISALALAGCEGFEFPGARSAPEASAAGAAAPAVAEERDVEAPEVFQARERALWDGRPTFGGVWVSHPDVTDPERVIIRNEANGTSVVGALFRPAAESPGPRIKVSADAATELGMVAGQPVDLSVTALRTEVVEVPQPAAAALPEAEPIETEALDDPLAAAAAAIDEAEGAAPVIRPAESAPAPVAAPAPRAASTLEKPFIQVGIFAVEGNANNTGASLRNAGIIPTVLRQESAGKVFWRVIVGPATSASERAEVLARVKNLGYSDAYFVTN